MNRGRHQTLQNFLAARKPYARGSDQAKAKTRSLAEFIAIDMRPLSVVEGKGFQILVEILNPRYTPVSRNHLLERYLVPMYNLTADAFKDVISRAIPHSITTDAWTTRQCQVSLRQRFTTLTHILLNLNPMRWIPTVLLAVTQEYGKPLGTVKEMLARYKLFRDRKYWGAKEGLCFALECFCFAKEDVSIAVQTLGYRDMLLCH